jgi:hypothetical protein
MSYFFGTAAPVVEIPLLPVSTKPICDGFVNADKTMENIPAELVEKLERKIAEIKAYLTSDPAEWEVFVQEKGVKGIRRFEEGKDLAVIRSETVMPFHIVDIFEFLNNGKNAPVLDPMVNHSVVLKRFSTHSWVGCVTLHGVRSFAVHLHLSSYLANPLYYVRYAAMARDQPQRDRELVPLETA